MASVDLEYNQGFKIYNANGTRFNNLVLHKATYETVVMSLGDKISGIVYYKNNKLVVNMTEYIMYKDVKYVLVNPPTVVKEGLVSDNGELKGMTKYSFTFYHPMYMLSNFPFSDVAVDDSQKKYLSQNKTFSWIGNLVDYKDKLNKNLEGTQWKVSIGTNVTDAEKNKLSEVLSFDNNTIADALKTAYETWEIPYIVDKVEAGTQDYLNGKRFIVQFGLPSNEIYEKDKNGNFILDDNNQKIPFVFKYGQGVGLKNNSRTPKNNKIVTRIAGYGSEDNIPYGYPQIRWYGSSDATQTPDGYPIYKGILGGALVNLIKHPFTRTHLMPKVYSQSLFNKVSPYLEDGSSNSNYNPNIELVDYYDADNTYPNPIKAGEPSYEIHEFEDIKPEFGSFSINSATPYDGYSDESITQNKFLSIVDDLYTETDIKAEKTQLNALRTSFVTQQQNSAKGTSGNYEYDWSFKTDGLYKKVKYTSSGANFEYVVNVGLTPATIDWDDTMDEQGNYVQSYFKVTIPALGFDLYASAAITQEMTINMRSGACIGCSFPVMVDWDDYKRNFYDKDGNFAPNGTQRNLTKYPNSTNGSITLILQKETNTFGTLMPNIYQKPASGDKFVVLGISLPTSYITTAEGKLETEMKKYMRDNNVYYYEYPLKFDEHFLISNEHILSQMKPNVIVNFEYAGVEQSLYIKQMSVKYNESPLPKYDITLTDDVDVVLNKIGEAIAEYRGQRQYENGGGNSETLDGNKFLRKDINDTASGTIRMLKGLQVGERFVTGLLGEGGIFRKDDDGTTYLECDRMYVRMKAYFDTVEVRRFLHSGGNRIASAAGMKCSRVEYIASNGLATQNVNNAVKFRCYFRAEDNGAKVTNDFVVGDLAYCKETNIDTNLSQHGYWRAVVGVSSNANSSGEHWIDLSKSDCSSTLNDVPIAQDDIIQLGNKTDKTRQGAIVEYVSGEDAPSYQIYQGINTYSLDDKNYIGLGYSSETGRAYMNVYGDMFVGAKPDSVTGKSPTYIKYVQDDGTEQHNPKLTIKGIVEMLSPDDPEETTTLDDFAKAITGDIEYLQQQIDGEIDTWFYDGVPTLNNYPASDWTTDNEKKEHLGDLYYDKLNGNAYRFIYDKDNETYSWLLLSDSAILEALRIANEAKDTADNKRRVFLTDAQHPHPTPPYDEGDLWVNAVWPYQGQSIGSTYNDEILKCIKPVPRKEGGSDVTEFSIGDWSAANGYKTALSDFINNTYASFVTNIQTQVDRKAQTWYLSFDPSYSWEGNEKQHVGDLWYCTDDIENTDYKKNTTWIYQERIDPDTGETVYYWAKADVPDEVFDMIDGKSAIYTEWGAWLDESGASSLQVRDLLIPAADIVRGNVTYKQNKVYRCTNRNTQNPVFEEISYTDDSAFNKYITQILNGTTETTSSAIVANALNAITTAITKAPATAINGGLVLTSLIGMRDTNSNVWAGISGLYKAAESVAGQYKGHGIASWYGGGMADWEVYKESHPTATINDTYAKSLFRFDGSGYLAGGNITWDAQGRVAIKDITTLVGGNNTDILNALTTFNNAFHFTTAQGSSTILNINPQYAFSHLEIYDANGNHSVATTDYVNDNFVTKAFFNRLFQAYSSSNIVDANKVSPNDTTTAINNLKILVGTWTEQYLSALGNNPNASGGGGISDLSAVLNELNSKDDLGTGVLVRNGLNNWSWMPYNAGTSGIDVDAMWTALGGTSSNQKIDNSHLSLKSLTFKVGASDANGVVYSPTGDANKTITFDAAANSGISVTKDSNGTFIIGYTMPNVTLSTTISDSDTSYTRFVVDAKGRVVKADKPTTLAGYGITDALTDAKIKSDYTWWGQKLDVNGKVNGMLSVDLTSSGATTLGSQYSVIQAKYKNAGGSEYGYNSIISLVGSGETDVTYNMGVRLGAQSGMTWISAGESGGTLSSVFTNMCNTEDVYISADGGIHLIAGVSNDSTSYARAMDILSNGNVGIGTTEPACKLHVNGTGCMTGGLIVGAYTQQNHMLYVAGSGLIKNNLTISNPDNTTTGAFLKIGGLYLVYDQANNAIKVSGSSNLSENTTANLYATGTVSALGSQSSGGQDYFNTEMMWDELAKTGSDKINNSHLSLSSLSITTKNGTTTYTPTSVDQTIDLSSLIGDSRTLLAWEIRPSTANTEFGDGKLRYYLSSGNMSTGKPTDDGHIIHMSWDWEGKSDAQIFVSTWNPVMKYRSMDGTTWREWKTVLDTDTAASTYLAKTDISSWAKATTKPTYSWSEITDKPLSGNSGNFGPVWGNYVPVKSDGVMEVGLAIDFHNTSNDGEDFAVRMQCQGVNRNIVYLPTSAGTLALTSQLSDYLSRSGGSMKNTNLVSNLNADMLDGKHLVTRNLKTPFDRVMYIDDAGVMEAGAYLDFHHNNNGDFDFSTRLYVGGGYGNMVMLPSSTGTLALTSDLTGYLSLSGGAMKNTNKVTNMNADLLDGHDSTYFVNTGTTWSKSTGHDGYILEFKNTTSSTADNPFSVLGGNAAVVIQNLPDSANWGAQLAFGFGSARLVWRNRQGSQTMSDWVGVIAGSADKLVTKRKIWGQDFDGSANVDGRFELHHNLASTSTWATGSGALAILSDTSNSAYAIGLGVSKEGGFGEIQASQYGVSASSLVLQKNGGNVGIGITSPQYKLHVNGFTYTSRLYLAENVYLEKTTYGVHLVGAGFYSDSFVSALGSNPDTQGGGGGVIELTGILGSLYNSTTALSTGALYYNGSTWSFQTLNQGTTLSAPLNSINGIGNPTGSGKQMLCYESGWKYMSVPKSISGLAVHQDNKQIGIKDSDNNISGYITVPFATDATNATNADKLDGKHASYFVDSGTTWSKSTKHDGFIVDFRNTVAETGNNPFSILGGNAATVIQSLPDNSTYGAQLAFGFGSARLLWRARNNSTSFSDWVGIIAGSADKLASKKKLWGQDFDGTLDVTGSITDCTSIDSLLYFDTTNKRIGVSSQSPNYTLDVSGNIHATQSSWLPSVHLFADSSNSTPYIDFHYNHVDGYTTRIIENDSGVLSITASTGITGLVVGSENAGDYIKIGKATLKWTANGLECDKDFYSTGAVSALGSGSSGGGGSIDVSFSEFQLYGDTLYATIGGQRRSANLNLSNFASYTDLEDYVKGVKVNGTTYSNKDANGIVDLGTISGGGNVNALNSFGTSITNANVSYNDAKFRHYQATNQMTTGKPASDGNILHFSWYDYMWDAQLALLDNNHGIQYRTMNGNGWNDWLTVITSAGGTINGHLYVGSLAVNGLNIDFNNSEQDAYAIYTDGIDVYTDAVWHGTFRSGSDINLKTIDKYVECTVDAAAKAPIFDFSWRNNKKKDLFLGTSAQYWKNVFPNAVSRMSNGYLSMDYGATALAATVSVARKVVDHELRIKQLVERVHELEEEIKSLKAA